MGFITEVTIRSSNASKAPRVPGNWTLGADDVWCKPAYKTNRTAAVELRGVHEEAQRRKQKKLGLRTSGVVSLAGSTSLRLPLIPTSSTSSFNGTSIKFFGLRCRCRPQNAGVQQHATGSGPPYQSRKARVHRIGVVGRSKAQQAVHGGRWP